MPCAVFVGPVLGCVAGVFAGFHKFKRIATSKPQAATVAGFSALPLNKDNAPKTATAPTNWFGSGKCATGLFALLPLLTPR